jgi:hypothetical protein
MKINYTPLIVLSLLFTFSCASYKAKFADDDVTTVDNSADKEIEKRFYLIGDAGNVNSEEEAKALHAFKKLAQKNSSSKDVVLFLGDNVYPAGLSTKNEADGKNKLDAQINAVKGLNGRTIFIPGNHDWYADGLTGLKNQGAYVEEALSDSKSFQPSKGCPIEKIDITDNIVLLVIDTQWYLTDWNKNPTINDNCDIKSRKEFFIEVEGELKKNNEKTILVAMHHPAYTNGVHGGFYNLEKHLFPFETKIPLPILGTLGAQIRTQGGVSPQDRYNVRYNELMTRMITMAKGNDRLIFASGHEHSLQYIEQEGIKQIVSGAGSKSNPVALGKGGKFAYGKQGFAVLDVFSDGSSEVKFYSAENNEPSLLYATTVHKPIEAYKVAQFPTKFETTQTASIYDKERTKKNKTYNWFWGKHYRYIYGLDLTVPVATLDTLMGGLSIERMGGGHQTRSLRLNDKDGRNFALRGVKKSAVQYLQSVVFTTNYLDDSFDDTATENLILDFYTASHPYATFVVSELSEAIGVYHTNPQLVYVPKHEALGKYNEDFGNELYIIEERPDDGFTDVASFGSPDAIESTSDVLKNLRKDEKYQIDKAAYIKARLFDMLLGDWDRHQDQWRWSRFNISDDKIEYRPIPRDRDQAFSNYDGAFLDFMKLTTSSTKQLQEYDGELKDIRWINEAGIKMDRNFTQDVTKELWLEQAKFIQQNLTDEIVDKAFDLFPKEVKDDVAFGIREKLKIRRGNLEDIASRYYDYLTKLVVMTGTDKDDHFKITRSTGMTKISISRIIDGVPQKPYRERVIKSNETREVWIYGLDDDDQFIVDGAGRNHTRIRIIGGQNNDVYTIENGKKVRIYDHLNKPNTVAKRGGATFRFRDIYSNNIYDFEKYIKRVNTIFPSVASNADDGYMVGLKDTFIVKGFKDSPYHQKHIFGAQYFVSTQGFNFEYNGEIANTFGTWNLTVGGRFASENYTQNFFGLGNETVNLDDAVDLNYNRVRSGIISGKIGVIKNGHFGSKLAISGSVERVEIEPTQGRFITDVFQFMPSVFEDKTFGVVDVTYSFSGYDNLVFPTRGMFFDVNAGAKGNLEDTNRTFGYVKPSVAFYNALIRSRKLVLKTMAQGQFNIGDDFEFYQAAVLGASNGLRGYRDQRFSGNSAIAFGADLRLSLLKFKTGLVPIELGIYGGYDYGRVWVEGEDSDLWHDSAGGGLLINAVDTLSGSLSVFNSDDGLRIAFGFGMSL